MSVEATPNNEFAVDLNMLTLAAVLHGHEHVPCCGEGARLLSRNLQPKMVTDVKELRAQVYTAQAWRFHSTRGETHMQKQTDANFSGNCDLAKGNN